MGLSPSLLPAADTTPDPAPTTLAAVLRTLDTMVASAEPAVTFTSAVRLCVPLICDAATIRMTGADQQAYAVTWPWSPTSQRHRSPTTTVRALFDGESTSEHPAYRGTLELQVRPAPGLEHAALAQLVVDRASALVYRERLVELVDSATARAAKLDVALESSREIGIAVGILMGFQKVTEEHASGLLREVSQRTYQALRDVALDVTETGTIQTPVAVESRYVAPSGSDRPSRRPFTHRAS